MCRRLKTTTTGDQRDGILVVGSIQHQMYAVVKERVSSIHTLVHAGNVGQCATVLARQGEDVCAISSTPKYI